MSGRTVLVVALDQPPGLIDGQQEIDSVPEQPGLPRDGRDATCLHDRPGGVHQVTRDAPHDDP